MSKKLKKRSYIAANTIVLVTFFALAIYAYSQIPRVIVPADQQQGYTPQQNKQLSKFINSKMLVSDLGEMFDTKEGK